MGKRGTHSLYFMDRVPIEAISGLDVFHAKDSFYTAPPNGATDPSEPVKALGLANAVDVTRVIGGYCPGGKEFLEMMLALSPPSHLNQTR